MLSSPSAPSGNDEFLEGRREMGMFMMKSLLRERQGQQMLVNLVSPPVPSLNILSVIILVQIINLSRRGCNKELLLKPSPLPAPAFFTVWLLRPISDTDRATVMCCILTRQENHYFDV